jgi:hypothetical protein
LTAIVTKMLGGPVQNTLSPEEHDAPPKIVETPVAFSPLVALGTPSR